MRESENKWNKLIGNEDEEEERLSGNSNHHKVVSDVN